MSRDSQTTSDRTLSIHMVLDDDLSSHSRLGYLLDESSVSDRESTPNPSSKEASPLGRRPREVILPDDWSIHDFPVDMSNEVFTRLRPRFQIPANVPIRKANLGEKCYDGRSSDVGFYEAAFIARLRLPLSFLHRQLASFMGVSIS